VVETSAGEVDILKAKEILDADHYGLKKVKDASWTIFRFGV